jgi:cell division protein FtsB
MTAQQIYGWWLIWLGIGGAIVVIAAALLITIVVLARRIASLAATGLAVVDQIEQNTKPIWQLNATNHVARQLLDGAQAIEGNAVAIVGALHAGEQRRAA